RQTMLAPTTRRDPIIDEEKMITGRPVVTQVARMYLAEMANQPPPQGVWKKLKGAVKSGLLSVVEALRSVTVVLGLTEPQSDEQRLASKFADKFSVTHGPGSNVMELRFVWDDALVPQRVMQTWVKVYLDERTTVLRGNSLVTVYEAKVLAADAQIAASK